MGFYNTWIQFYNRCNALIQTDSILNTWSPISDRYFVALVTHDAPNAYIK